MSALRKTGLSPYDRGAAPMKFQQWTHLKRIINFQSKQQSVLRENSQGSTVRWRAIDNDRG